MLGSATKRFPSPTKTRSIITLFDTILLFSFSYAFFFIVAFEYDGHREPARFLRNKAVSRTVCSFFAVPLAPVRPDFPVSEGLRGIQ